ncbi:MFS transporter [Solicola sp. PLA-1-18]|uniref:MFS transporter n=1 Tax=Solicola sp. PLA-1-18 TaxID=3380532 RepID=UPI003B7F1D98
MTTDRSDPRTSTDLHRVQRRTVGVLAAAQVVGGIGSGSGLSVGALLLADMSGSSAVAGLATTMLTLGAAAGSMPLARLAAARGRRPGLALGWALAATGGAVVVTGAALGSVLLVLLGLAVSGISSATNLQSRYAATDLAEPSDVGRSLGLVVWSTTIGAVLGPNLTGPGAAVARSVGLPDLAGPFCFSVVSFGVAAVLMLLALRPDPLVLARTREPAAAPGTTVVRHGFADAWRTVRANPTTSAGVATVATAHAVMVSVMAMTPVHMQDHGAALEIIGLTISLHIAGMFALSPVMGWLVDRWGATRTAVLGQVVLLVAVAVAGTAGASEVRITVGLVLLGLGWSASLISGSAMVASSVDGPERTAVQGLSDVAMNLAGALGGLLAGAVVALAGFEVLAVAAGVLVVPLLVLHLRRGPLTGVGAARSAD